MEYECRGGPRGRLPKNNKDNYPNRQSLRLKDYDYTREGVYFITICTVEGMILFDEYPALRNVIEEQWRQLSKRFVNIQLDEFVIMPNHVHGIIIITKRGSKTIGDMVGAYKSLCVNDGLNISRRRGFVPLLDFGNAIFMNVLSVMKKN